MLVVSVRLVSTDLYSANISCAFGILFGESVACQRQTQPGATTKLNHAQTASCQCPAIFNLHHKLSNSATIDHLNARPPSFRFRHTSHVQNHTPALCIAVCLSSFSNPSVFSNANELEVFCNMLAQLLGRTFVLLLQP